MYPHLNKSPDHNRFLGDKKENYLHEPEKESYNIFTVHEGPGIKKKSPKAIKADKKAIDA